MTKQEKIKHNLDTLKETGVLQIDGLGRLEVVKITQRMTALGKTRRKLRLKFIANMPQKDLVDNALKLSTGDIKKRLAK